MSTTHIKVTASIATLALIVIAFILAIWGWVGNVIWTFHQTDIVQLILGGVGVFFFPLGIIHYWFF